MTSSILAINCLNILAIVAALRGQLQLPTPTAARHWHWQVSTYKSSKLKLTNLVAETSNNRNIKHVQWTSYLPPLNQSSNDDESYTDLGVHELEIFRVDGNGEPLLCLYRLWSSHQLAWMKALNKLPPQSCSILVVLVVWMMLMTISLPWTFWG